MDLLRLILVVLSLVGCNTHRLSGVGEIDEAKRSAEDDAGAILRRCTDRNPLGQDQEEAQTEDDIIVTFNSYKNLSDLVAFVYDIAGDCDEWKNVARNNVAARLYPTDFLLIRMNQNISQPSLLENLRATASVKAITKERQIDSRRLFSYREEGDDTDMEPELEFSRFKIMSMEEAEADPEISEEDNLRHQRHILAKGLFSITKVTNADQLWKNGHSGKGVKVAVFDTGIREGHSSFRNIVERTDWTDEKTVDDHIGHGTFVAGVIGSTHSQCAGFAPDAEIYSFRVFNRKQVSYTSWFLDAFNYAIQQDIDVLNLSIGGPDFLDRPFVEKVWEMSANGIIIVSAIGNDGPRYGTLNNPADQLDVIGVGGITYDDEIAPFSSRGMTTWEIPRGYGRVKPDIVAYGKGIRGPNTGGGCRSLSGTSVASPVVAGMVSLLAGMANPMHLNPAMIKQVIADTAAPIPKSHIFEQGMGKVDLIKAAEYVEKYKPHASVIPNQLDLTKCPYMWPFCTQPLYYSAMPVQVNLTVLNPLSVSGSIENARLVLNTDGFAADKPLITAEFSQSQVLWPWSGYLAVSISVTKAGISMSGKVSGKIVFDVVSDQSETSTVSIPLKVELSPPPPREKRLLWDQFHSLRYPSGYFPRDNLAIKTDILDWNGDHIHTNFRELYNHLRSLGYYVEISGKDWTCIDSSNYGALLLIDPEEAYFEEEIAKLASDVYSRGLSLLVVGEWQNVKTMKKLKFLDQNTQSWWLPQTGGANLPQLNRVLEPFHIAFSDRILDGSVTVGNEVSRYESGTSIHKFPKNGRIFSIMAKDVVSGSRRYFPVMGIHSTGSDPGNGRVAVFGDSNCLDENHRRGPACYAVIEALLNFVCKNETDEKVFPQSLQLKSQFVSDFGELPVPMDGVHFERYSNVAGENKVPECLAKFPKLVNVSSLTPTVNHSDSQPYLPAPDGGFHSNTQQNLPLFGLLFVISVFAMVAYYRCCRGDLENKGADLVSFASIIPSTNRAGINDSQVKTHSPDDSTPSKWGRGGQLHKRTTNSTLQKDVFKV